MSVTVHLSGHLKSFTGGEIEVHLPGEFATLADALETLFKLHRALRDRILTEQGDIRKHVNIFVGSNDVKRLDGLQTPMKGDEMHIFNAVSGG